MQFPPHSLLLLTGPFRSAVLFLTVALFPWLASAAPARADAVGTPARPVYRVALAASSVVVDGSLDEAVWNSATRIELKYEIQPGENVPAPAKTELLLAYDEAGLYAAFRASDPTPERIRANLTDRDQAFRDDFVGIVVDTFNDERRAFEFFVNPFGVQMDATVNDVGGGGNQEDFAWDAIWQSAGRLTPDGYVVEAAIPFSSLRFQPSDGEQTWGFYAFRAMPRNVRHQIADVPFRRDVACQLCQVGKLVGFAGASPGRNLELTPTVTALEAESADAPGDPLVSQGSDFEAGLTATWGITPGLTLSGTLNPDFSQVEADVAQLDVNNQFALFFPERRPFFLEGADFFATPLPAVFTRNVADPIWGTKLSGKVGANALGLFIARDEVTNLLIPGSEGSDATTLEEESTDVALRYRRDLGKVSTLGFLYTGREGEGYHNRVAGMDGLFRLTETQTVRAQALVSLTQYPRDLADEFGQERNEISDGAFLLRYNYDGRNWEAWATAEDRGEAFRADLGFLPQVDLRSLRTGGQRIFWGEEGDPFTRITLGSNVRVEETQDGESLFDEQEVWASYSGPMQSYFWVGGRHRERLFDGARFEDWYGSFYGNIRPSGRIFFELDGGYGDTIDFANTRPARQLRFGPAARLNVGRRTQISLRHRFSRLDVDGGELFTANLTEVRAVYQISARSYFRLIGQRTGIRRDPTLYKEVVDAKSESLASQALFAYKLNPRTVFFLGYSDGRQGDETIDLAPTGRSVFLKLGYAWTL